MRVCFFGTYTMEEGYPVNRTVFQGLRAAGIEVVECRADLWKAPRQRWSGKGWFFSPLFWTRGLIQYIKLIFKFFRMGPYDVILVGYLGHQDVFLARMLRVFRRKPVAFVAFNSLYETLVEDRAIFKAGGWMSRGLRWLDRTACRLSDLVILDTREHIRYFTRELAVPEDKFLRIFVGPSVQAPRPASPPRPQDPPRFRVLFVGTYIPLHGIDTILQTAQRLQGEPDLEFILIGNGQLYSDLREWADNAEIQRLKFIHRWVPQSEVMEWFAGADISLGIFGKSAKAARVIPCKVFDALAMGKPIITADTPAARELLTHGDNALLCRAG